MSDGNHKRPETGSMRFGDDWPGVFLRGDDAFAYSLTLTNLLDAIDGAAKRSADEGSTVSGGLASLVVMSSFLRGLASDLASCDMRDNPSIVNGLRDFAECIAPEQVPTESVVDPSDHLCEMGRAVDALIDIAKGGKR